MEAQGGEEHNGIASSKDVLSIEDLEQEEKEIVQQRLTSDKLFEEQESHVLIEHIDLAKWRSLGNALKFNYIQLDSLDNECEDDMDKVEKMIIKWCRHEGSRATVKRLAKALYLHGQFKAILQLPS